MTSPAERAELIDALDFGDVDEPDEAVDPPEPQGDFDDTAPDHEDAFVVWEYTTVLGGSGAKQAGERLNALGAEGWELVGVEPPQQGGQTVLYLKRQARP